MTPATEELARLDVIAHPVGRGLVHAHVAAYLAECVPLAVVREAVEDALYSAVMDTVEGEQR